MGSAVWEAGKTKKALRRRMRKEEGEGEEAVKDVGAEQQYGKPPPLHTAADWKIVLHLPEIETWLRMTSERVRDLTYSVQQDADSKHVDVHLVQLKVRPAFWKDV